MSDISHKTEINVALFGCWNNYKLSNGSYPVVNVCTHLKRNESKYDELIILGDNFYPSKEKVDITSPDGTIKQVKKNVYDIDKFNNGFELIRQISIPNKYLIMGNHDIEDFNYYSTRCINLDDQLKKTDYLKIMFPFKSCPVANTGFKYIFIDTNLYNLSKNEDTCFNVILDKSALELKNEQNEFLRCELRDSEFRNFIICGHEPLFSIKTKEDESGKIKAKKNILDEELINILFETEKNNITYVCADVHMYQTGIITNKKSQQIKQIVCGTGGADKDSYSLEEINYNINDNYYFKLESFQESFGYVELNISKDNITHKYIKVIINDTGELSQEEYRLKYLKYKNKYNMLKQRF